MTPGNRESFLCILNFKMMSFTKFVQIYDRIVMKSFFCRKADHMVCNGNMNVRNGEAVVISAQIIVEIADDALVAAVGIQSFRNLQLGTGAQHAAAFHTAAVTKPFPALTKLIARLVMAK